MRFSVRTLLFMVAAVAIALGLWTAYRREFMCQVRWLAAGSGEAQALFPKPAVETLPDGKHRMRYYAMHRPIQALLPAVRLGSNYRMLVDEESLEIVADDADLAQAQLESLQTADVPKPGVFVIRGRVIDRGGKPLAGATVDLMGPYVFINHFESRNDGTFIMCLDDGGRGPPAGAGYYLRVRAPEETAERLVRWNSSTFSLDPTLPERDVIVVVPAAR